MNYGLVKLYNNYYILKKNYAIRLFLSKFQKNQKKVDFDMNNSNFLLLKEVYFDIISAVFKKLSTDSTDSFIFLK